MVPNERIQFETFSMTPEYSIKACKVKTICQTNWKKCISSRYKDRCEQKIKRMQRGMTLEKYVCSYLISVFTWN